jgi:activator of 2-hydroxyglutaryl-CoA dehydratase
MADSVCDERIAVRAPRNNLPMTCKGRYKEAQIRANALPGKGSLMRGSSPQYRLGVDVGGTHTDLVLLDSATGQLLVEKVASTPKNPALGVLEGAADVSQGLR